MKPLLNNKAPETHHKAEWPEQPANFGKVKPLFAPRPPLRRITVMIDNELLSSTNLQEYSRQAVLSGLLLHPYVQCYRYSDDGPPSDLPRKQAPVPFSDKGYVDGWVELEEPGDEANFVVRKVRYTRSESLSRTAITGEIMKLPALDTTATSYSDDEPKLAASKRFNDALAAQAAEAIGADLFITERPYLHEKTPLNAHYSGGTTCCSVRDALTILGLYLRTQGVFEIERSDSYSHLLDEGFFYWVGIRELLPEAWRWFNACVQEATATADNALTHLGGSLLNRLQRALRARDNVYRALHSPQTNNSAEDALSALDLVMLNLMGGLDASARVAHRLLVLPDRDVRNAGWQRQGWVNNIRPLEPSLANVVADGSANKDALTVLSTLRNSIHGEALQPLGIMSGPRNRTDTLVGVPQADAMRLMEAIDRIGGRDAWGVHEKIPGRYHIQPDVLVDQLFQSTLALLNELLKETPVERFPHVNLAPEASLPPDEGMFTERIRQSIRWQLGF